MPLVTLNCTKSYYILHILCLLTHPLHKHFVHGLFLGWLDVRQFGLKFELCKNAILFKWKSIFFGILDCVYTQKFSIENMNKTNTNNQDSIVQSPLTFRGSIYGGFELDFYLFLGPNH